MNITWIVGLVSLFPEAEKLLKGRDYEIKSTGGWIQASAQMLAKEKGISLSVVMVSPQVRELTVLKGVSINYYVIPDGRKGCWSKVLEDLKPDLVHIHGTENFANILAFFKEKRNEKVVVSIQGVAGPIAKYSYAGIPWIHKLIFTRPFDFYNNRLMFHDSYQQTFKKHSAEIIGLAKNVIGRTICDRSYVWSVNSEINYYFCNETLREDFYTGRWIYDNCTPTTIFISQASRPLKGLHLLLQALPLVRREYPNVKVRIAGDDFVKKETIKDKMKLTGYGNYISFLIRKFQLSDVVTFIGPQNAQGIKTELLNANLFISPSTIENSPNSLCEAQLLGVPCLSSYVGGASNMIPNEKCGELYRFDDIEEMAYKICRWFDVSKNFDNTEMIRVARNRHDAINNINTLVTIYKSIINE